MVSALKRATQMGEFEVAKGGGIWVANRASTNAILRLAVQRLTFSLISVLIRDISLIIT